MLLLFRFGGGVRVRVAPRCSRPACVMLKHHIAKDIRIFGTSEVAASMSLACFGSSTLDMATPSARRCVGEGLASRNELGAELKHHSN